MATLVATCAAALLAEKPTEEQVMRAIGAMRTLNTAEVTYASTYKDRGFACTLPTLGEHPDKKTVDADHAGFIDETLASGKRLGYIFKVKCTGKNAPYTGYATQAEPESGEGRAFCSDQTGIIRFSDDGKASTCFKSGKPIE